MAVDGIPLTLNQVTVAFRDGTSPTPISLSLTDDTSITIDGLTGGSLNENVNVQRRGQHYGVVSGDRIYPTIQIEGIFTGFAGHTSAPGTPIEFATFQGVYSSNVSTVAGGTRSVKTFNVVISVEASDFGGTNDHLCTLHDCYLQAHPLYTDGSPSTYSMTLVCTGEIDGDLSFAEV